MSTALYACGNLVNKNNSHQFIISPERGRVFMAYKVPEPEDVIDLARKLKDAKELVNVLQDRWNALFMPSSNGTEESEATAEEERRSSTLANRIMALLNDHPTESFSASTVSALLDAKQTSVASILSRLVSEGKIRKEGHSEYRAIETDEDIPF
jgi:hypothetical protein